MRYIKSFANDAEIQAAVDNGTLGKPYVALNESAGTIDWDSKEKDYSKLPLTFEILTGGSLYFLTNNNLPNAFKTLQYSKNGGEWTSVTSSNGGSGTTICDVVAGDIVAFKGINDQIGWNTSIYTRFASTCYFNVYGNIMSILYGDNYQTKKTFNKNYTYQFRGLFSYTKVVDAYNLILPATALTNYCYQYMFSECKSLTTAPELPAPTITGFSYEYMFKGCSNLNYIKCLATSLSGSNYLYNWVQNVAATGTFAKAANATFWSTGNNGIPSGWTVVNVS